MAATSEVSMSRVWGRARQISVCMFSCLAFFSLKLMMLSKAMLPVLLYRAVSPMSLCRALMYAAIYASLFSRA